MSIIFSLLKSRSLTIVRRILGIKIVKSSETSHHIVRNLVDLFKKLVRKLILKTVMHPDVSCHNQLLARSQEKHFLKQTSHLMK
jgi:hypothetical protein